MLPPKNTELSCLRNYFACHFTNDTLMMLTLASLNTIRTYIGQLGPSKQRPSAYRPIKSEKKDIFDIT